VNDERAYFRAFHFFNTSFRVPLLPAGPRYVGSTVLALLVVGT